MKYRLHVSRVLHIEIPRLGLLCVFMSTMYTKPYTVKTLLYIWLAHLYVLISLYGTACKKCTQGARRGPNAPFHARRRGGGGAGARKGPNVAFHAWRRGGGARKGGSYAISAAHLALNLSLAPCGAGGDRGAGEADPRPPQHLALALGGVRPPPPAVGVRSWGGQTPPPSTCS